MSAHINGVLKWHTSSAPKIAAVAENYTLHVHSHLLSSSRAKLLPSGQYNSTRCRRASTAHEPSKQSNPSTAHHMCVAKRRDRAPPSQGSLLTEGIPSALVHMALEPGRTFPGPTIPLDMVRIPWRRASSVPRWGLQRDVIVGKADNSRKPTKAHT